MTRPNHTSHPPQRPGGDPRRALPQQERQAGKDFGDEIELVLAAGNHLLNTRNSARYVAQVLQGVTAVATRLERTTGPFTGVEPAALQARVAAVDLDSPLPDTAAALQELEEVYLRDAVYFHDARYAAHLNCPVVIPALVGEAILSAVNSSLDTWDQSAGATMIERRLIDWAAERLHLGDTADGIFTSGGSQSNLQALLMARNHAVAGLRRDPARAGLRLPALLETLRIFTSADSHFSSGSQPPCWASASMPSSAFPAPLTTGWTRRPSPTPWRKHRQPA